MKGKEAYKVIKVSNDLVRAVQRLTLSEKRLIMLGVSKLDKHLNIEQIIEISAKEYAALYLVSTKTAYEVLKEGRSRLWSRELTIPELKHGLTINWLYGYRYNDGEGTVSLRFHTDLDGYLFGLKDRFTQYLLSRASEFKHLYSWRLFELLMQYRTTGLLRVSVDAFKQSLEIPEAYNKDFGLVRRKVIDLAIGEIKEKSSLDVNYEVIKRGRKITDLEFTFKPEPKEIYPKQEAKRPLLPDTKSNTKPASVPDDNQLKTEALSQFLGYQQRAKLLNETIEQLATEKEVKQFKKYGFMK